VSQYVNGTIARIVTGFGCIEFDADGVLIVTGGKERRAAYVAITTGPTVVNGLFWSTIKLGREVLFQCLRRDATALVENYIQWQRAYWRALFERERAGIGRSIAALYDIKNDPRYLRKSSFDVTSKRVSYDVVRLNDLCGLVALGMEMPEGCDELQDFLINAEAWRRKRNQEWMHRRDTEYAYLFECIEKHPLTAAQRKACVVDEDNVLVLAGAGTGKTSTMMAKAAYLIESGLARPEEILMLAYANEAKTELKQRVMANEKYSGVRVETFHTLGKSIIAKVEKYSPSVASIANDEQKMSKFVDDAVSALEADEDFVETLRNYFISYLVPVKNRIEFKSEGEYKRYLRNNEIRSFQGDVVKSFEELEIANYLFMNGINYVYEADYEHDTRTIDYQQYRPDFYLPDLGVYIEHFGIARDRSTAPGIDAVAYQKGMEWKQKLHKDYGTALIETFSYEAAEGKLLDELERKLHDHCEARDMELVTFQRKKPYSTLKELGTHLEFSRLLTAFTNSFKASTHSLEGLRASLVANYHDLRFRVFLRIFEYVLAIYEEKLELDKTIDFNDMISRATAYIEDGSYRSSYKYIMVDEFQDISQARADLIRLMRDAMPGCGLFVVGDDWQAIYRFTGSDVMLTTNFEKHFGFMDTVALDKTFRFNDRISAVASQFVQVNPNQLKKTITTHETSGRSEVVIVGDEDKEKALLRSLDAIAQDAGAAAATVYLLGRYKKTKPENLKALKGMYPHLSIEYYTAHASKGREADYVVILDVIEGKFGFPSMVESDPILERVLPNADKFSFAEERRLFYVALTRARRSAYILTNPLRQSVFVKELIDKGYDIGFDRESLATELKELATCPGCLAGVLVKRSGPYGEFYGCSLYPYCKETPDICMTCGDGALVSNGREHECSNPDCGFSVRSCPRCGKGYLRKKNSQMGPFLSCSKWKKDSATNCGYTDNIRRNNIATN
jgi:DNA helicase-4